MGCLVPPTTWAPVVGWQALMKAWANQQNHTEAHQRRGTTADGSEDPRQATRGGGPPTEPTHGEDPWQTSRKTHGRRRGEGAHPQRPTISEDPWTCLNKAASSPGSPGSVMSPSLIVKSDGKPPCSLKSSSMIVCTDDMSTWSCEAMSANYVGRGPGERGICAGTCVLF